MSDDAQHIPGRLRTLSEPVAREVRDAYVTAENDLFWLTDHGALAGVAEIIRERRRQVQVLGRSAEHDDTEHTDGWLMHEAVRRVQNAGRRVAEGVGGAEDIEEACREAGALLAAEADRLFRMLTPGRVTVVIPPEAGA
jgi:hypothetical protein